MSVEVAGQSETLRMHKDGDFYKNLPPEVAGQIDAVEKLNPQVAAAYIAALERAVRGFELVDGEENFGRQEALRKQVLKDVYRIFQLMLKPHEFVEAAKIVFASPFWVQCLTGQKSPAELEKIEHIIDANRLMGEAVGDYLWSQCVERGGSGEVASIDYLHLDLGFGSGNTVKAADDAVRTLNGELEAEDARMSVRPQYRAVELGEVLIAKADERFDLPVTLSLHQGDVSDFLDGQGDNSADVITANYVLHHLYLQLFLKAMVEAGRVKIEDGFVYFDGQKLMKEEDFDRSKFEDDDIENADQYKALERCFAKLKPGGLLMIADPGSGLSRSFNTFMIRDGVAAAKRQPHSAGFAGMMEVGPSCFTSLGQMVEILERIGFEIDIEVLQYHDADGGYHRLQNAGINLHKSDIRNDYDLGYLVVAKKPKETSAIRSGVGEAAMGQVKALS